MHILWSLIVGLVVGAIAKLLMPGKDPGGIIVTALLGVAGAMLAAFIGRALGWYQAGDVGPGLIASIVGAMLLLGIYRLVTRRRAVV
ncbi:MAG TPA: GlsB/YeaQ/YmgE family stress response membrane protein [Polyangia bacterium]|nr:GlsB/YeaQ/YmgE family stress response membrane protein [Polyangia bacterium]